MASTWSRFTSHKCVSTSLGMCTVQNSHFYLINNTNMTKFKTAVSINHKLLHNINAYYVVMFKGLLTFLGGCVAKDVIVK